MLSLAVRSFRGLEVGAVVRVKIAMMMTFEEERIPSDSGFSRPFRKYGNKRNGRPSRSGKGGASAGEPPAEGENKPFLKSDLTHRSLGTRLNVMTTSRQISRRQCPRGSSSFPLLFSIPSPSRGHCRAVPGATESCSIAHRKSRSRRSLRLSQKRRNVRLEQSGKVGRDLPKRG